LQGLLIVVPLLYEYLAARRFDLRRVPVDVLALALVPLGWLAFVVYVLVLVGDPRAIVESRSAWGRQFPPPWDAAGAFFSQPLGAHGRRLACTNATTN